MRDSRIFGLAGAMRNNSVIFILFGNGNSLKRLRERTYLINLYQYSITYLLRNPFLKYLGISHEYIVSD